MAPIKGIVIVSLIVIVAVVAIAGAAVATGSMPGTPSIGDGAHMSMMGSGGHMSGTGGQCQNGGTSGMMNCNGQQCSGSNMQAQMTQNSNCTWNCPCNQGDQASA